MSYILDMREYMLCFSEFNVFLVDLALLYVGIHVLQRDSRWYLITYWQIEMLINTEICTQMFLLST